MSQATFGPPVSLDAPAPTPPAYRLLDAATLVPEASDRWMNGAAVWGNPPDDGAAWDPCSAGTFRHKEAGGAPPLPVFGSFVSYLPMTCSALSVGDPLEFAVRALAAFEARESGIVENELVSGDALATNPHLADPNVDVLAGTVGAPTAVSPQEGLALLEDAIGGTRQLGLIHAPPSVASAWVNRGPLVARDGTILRTVATWTPVAVGDGYIGEIPEGAPALSGGDQQWAWATLPVQIRRAEARLVPSADRIFEALERETNVVTFRAEREYLVTYEPPSSDWDGGLQAAVLIDRSIT